MELLIGLEPDVDDLRRGGAHQEGEDRDQILEDCRPLPLEQGRTDQHHVSRLGVGEDPAPADIGVGVLEAAGQDNEHRGPEAVGHLALKGLNGSHVVPSFPGR